MSKKIDRKKARVIAGVCVLCFTIGSFAFMLVEPFIPNVVGEMQDAQFLESIDQRINATRTSTFTVTFQYLNGTPVRNIDVQYNQTGHDFYFGCNFFGYEGCGSPENNENYKQFFKKTFNLAVLPFYWAYAEPERGNLVQEPWLESAISWCEANNITVKGHPLVWSHPAGNPGWLPANETAKKALVQQRVQHVVDEYKGRVKIWDVVNEPSHWDPYYGDSKFGYVKDAFTWAREKDAGAALSINDYGILGQDFGYGPYYNLIKQDLDAKTPISCIGIQGHEPRTDWFPAVNMWQTFEGYKVLGLPIHITELMVTSAGFPITNSWKKGLWSEENQAEYLERLYKTAFAHPAVDAIIYWELWEGSTWMEGAPLVKTNWEPKLAYTRISNLVNNKWHSASTARTNSSGTIAFTGFYGIYNMTVPALGRAFHVQARRNDSRNILVTI